MYFTYRLVWGFNYSIVDSDTEAAQAAGYFIEETTGEVDNGKEIDVES